MTRHVTLVALYGEKPAAFASLVAACQNIASGVLRDAFTPYAMEQIHGTIVGLERRSVSESCNAAFAEFRGQKREMDVSGFIQHVRASELVPFRIQVGGYREGDTPFLSEGRTPHERSVSARGETIVLVGWPVVRERQRPDQNSPNSEPLDAIRREAQRFGILHRYHPTPAHTDNHFFFRIGLVDGAPEDQMALAEQRIRTALGEHAPVEFEVGLDELAVAAYTDTRLPLDTTEHWPLSDPRIDDAFIAGLYA